MDTDAPRFLAAEWCTTLPIISTSSTVEGSDALRFYTHLGFTVDATDAPAPDGGVQLRSGGAVIRLHPVAAVTAGDGPVVRFTVADVAAVRARVESEFPAWVHPANRSGPVLRPHGLQWTAIDPAADVCIWFVQPVPGADSSA